MLILLVVEALSRIAGVSYLKFAYSLSGSINQGSFFESYSFLFEYLFKVEKLWRIVAVSGFGLGLWYVFNLKHHKKSSLIAVSLWLLLMLLAYTSYCFFLNGVVRYGRLWHQYLPIFTILSVLGLSNMFKNKKISIILLFSALGINYVFSHYQFNLIGFPRDFIFIREMS